MSFNILSEIEESHATFKNGIIKQEHSGRIGGYLVNNRCLLINGDQDAGFLYIDDKNAITISFNCLARFLNGGEDPSNLDIERALCSIISVKFTQDEKISGSKNKKPGAGFVWLELIKAWHRSASALIRITDELKEETFDILMGVDDDQYFGCELPILVDTLEEAYDSLIPKHIKKVDVSNLQRQGEWFFVKIEDNPMSFEGAEKFTINCEDVDGIQYYLRGRNDNEESNTHVVSSKSYTLVDDTFGINEGKKIPIFENPIIMHNQHPSLQLKGYWWPIENSAVRSYSEEGVD